MTQPTPSGASCHLAVAPAVSDAASKEAAARLQPRLLTIAEAATVLNVPESWLRTRVTARLVPFTLIGRHVRFSDEHLAAIISAGEQKPAITPVGQGLSRRARVRG